MQRDPNYLAWTSATPFSRRNGRFPAKFTNWRRSVGNSEKGAHGPGCGAFEHAAVNFYLQSDDDAANETNGMKAKKTVIKR